MFNWFKPTVDSVIADFTKTITKLEKLAQDHFETAILHTTEASRLSNLAEEFKAESDRARTIANKIKTLVA